MLGRYKVENLSVTFEKSCTRHKRSWKNHKATSSFNFTLPCLKILTSSKADSKLHLPPLRNSKLELHCSNSRDLLRTVGVTWCGYAVKITLILVIVRTEKSERWNLTKMNTTTVQDVSRVRVPISSVGLCLQVEAGSFCRLKQKKIFKRELNRAGKWKAFSWS